MPSAAAIGRGQRGLADAGFALEEQRALQLQREEQRHRERAIGDVVLLRQAPLQVVDGREVTGASVQGVGTDLEGLKGLRS